MAASLNFPRPGTGEKKEKKRVMKLSAKSDRDHGGKRKRESKTSASTRRRKKRRRGSSVRILSYR